MPGRKWEHKDGSRNIPDPHYGSDGKWRCYGCGGDLRQKGRNLAEQWAKIEARITKGPECWTWAGAHSTYGYSNASWNGGMVGLHRLMYQRYVGPIPKGYAVDHLCRNRGCVRPDHLEAVTQQENVRRGEAGINNRSKTHCPAGHEYTPQNTYQYGANSRQCRTCTLSRRKELRAGAVAA